MGVQPFNGIVDIVVPSITVATTIWWSLGRMERSRYRGADINTSSSNQSACGVLGDAETLLIGPLSVAQLDPCALHTILLI